MNPFLKAVQSGYSDNDILSHVSRHFPRMKGMVSKALKSGYTAQQIIEFLSSQGSSVNTKGKSQSDILKANSDADASIAQGAAKTGAALAGSALGSYALNRAVGGPLGQAAQGLFGGKEPIAQSAVSPNQALPTGPSLQQAAAQPIAGSSSIAAQAAAPSVLPKGKASEIFQSLKLDKQAKNLLDSQPPEVVAKILEHNFLGKDQLKQLVESTGVPFQELVKAFAEEGLPSPQLPQLSQSELIESNTVAPGTLKQKQDLAQGPLSQNVQKHSTPLPESVQPETEVIDEISSESIPEQETPESGNRTEIKTTALPDGRIGKVLSEKNGISKIEVDGEIKHRKTEDLIGSNLSEDELADLYEKAFMSLPKSERSSNLFWGGYDEEKNQFAYLPHAGALYIYDDVPLELATKIKDLLVNAKTTGSSAFGAWSKGDPSRGAAMFELIEQLKGREKQKASEKSKLTGNKEVPEKEYSGKFQPVHAPFQNQQKILKKRHSEAEKAKRKKLNPYPKRKRDYD